MRERPFVDPNDRFSYEDWMNNEATTGLGARPLPCPFCGSANIEDEQGETYRWRRAYCVDCGARGGEVRTLVTGSGANTRALAEARRDAFHEWNTRVGVQYEIDVALAAQQQRQAAPEGWVLVADVREALTDLYLMGHNDGARPVDDEETKAQCMHAAVNLTFGRIATPPAHDAPAEPTDFQLEQLFDAAHHFGDFGREFRERARVILRTSIAKGAEGEPT